MIERKCKRKTCNKTFQFNEDKVRVSQEYCSAKCREMDLGKETNKRYHDKVKRDKKRRSFYSFQSRY